MRARTSWIAVWRPRLVVPGSSRYDQPGVMGCAAGAYSRLGFDVVADDAFQPMVLARMIEPTSKADTIRVLGEIGVGCPSQQITG